MKPPKPRRPITTSDLFGFARPRRGIIWRRIVRRLQFHPPRTTPAASSRRRTSLLLLIAGGSLTQNPGKIGLLIQAVRKFTSAPAHFWDRGARWFVARFYGLGQLVKSCRIFSEEIRWFFEKRPVLMPCQEKFLPSRAARGYINSREEQRSRHHGDSRWLEIRGERLSRSVMER